MAKSDRLSVCAEIRTARLILGRSIEAVSVDAGMSSSHVSRIERGDHQAVTHEQLVVLGAAVGLDIRTRVYPGPDRPLDAAQVGLIRRIQARLSKNVTLRTEVPLPRPGDQRAWDGVLGGLSGSSERLPFDADTHLVDIQAQHRRLRLKCRDAGFEHVLWVVARTRHNRAMFEAAAGLLTGDFPLSPRHVLAALAAGRHPGASAIILL